MDIKMKMHISAGEPESKWKRGDYIMDGFYQEILDRGELQRVQNQFCMVAEVYAFCVDSTGVNLTDVSGEEEERERLAKKVPREELLSLSRRLSQSSLEDQAIEDTDIDALKYAAVSVKEEGKTVLTWLVYGVLSDAESTEGKDFMKGFRRRTTLRRFGGALDLLREISSHMVGDKILAQNARAESHQSRCSREEMEDALQRNTAITNVIRMSANEAPVEKVMSGILAVIGRFLKIDCAYLCSVDDADAKDMDVSAHWQSGPASKDGIRTGKQPRPAYLHREKTLVFSSDSGRDGYELELGQADLKALAAFPIILDNRIAMYACFGVKYGAYHWEVEEIKFLNDCVKIIQSTLDRRMQEDSLVCSAVEEVLHSLGNSVYVRDQENNRILFTNRSFREHFQSELEQDTLFSLFESKIPQGTESGSVEVCLEERGNWYDLFYRKITWADGKKALLCSIYDVTEKKMYQQKSERQVYTDFLTGLCNRFCCERDLEKCVAEAKRTGSEAALLYLDLDDFKHINDSLGHQYGDVLLKSIASGMRNVQGIHNSCYRMGGDEFGVIVPPDQYKMLDRIVKELKAVFGRPWLLKDADYYCTMSMGIVHIPAEGEDVQELVRKADIAMFEAKKSGRNCVVIYDDSIRSNSDKRLNLEKSMRDAAVDGYKEFEVYYQPIVDIQNHNTCVGAEALIRWNSMEMGLISPADFIPLAEYLGLINPIGSHVLEQACEACKRWNDSGYPAYKVNVNLSLVQLKQPDIVKTISKIIRKTRINPRNLMLEITEGLAVNDLESTKKTLLRLKKLGVGIALDDFGTGYSSLSHIKNLPFDTIKVDQSFVMDLAEDAYAKSFIKMLTDLALVLDVDICVEGVETKKQCQILEDMKVRLIQGYYFDRPMPGSEFEKKYVL